MGEVMGGEQSTMVKGILQRQYPKVLQLEEFSRDYFSGYWKLLLPDGGRDSLIHM